MPGYSLNGAPVFSAVLRLPLEGVWQLDAVVSPDTAQQYDGAAGFSGSVKVQLGDLALAGTIFRGWVTRTMAHLRIVGGAGKLSQIVKPKAYKQSSDGSLTLGQVIRELVTDAGEQLSPTVVPSTKRLAYWARIGMPAADALRVACANDGYSWRVLPDGTVWYGVESWPDVSPRFDGEMIDELPAVGEAIFGVLNPSLVAGCTLNGRQISCVEHRCAEDGIRSHVWYVDA